MKDNVRPISTLSVATLAVLCLAVICAVPAAAPDRLTTSAHPILLNSDQGIVSPNLEPSRS